MLPSTKRKLPFGVVLLVLAAQAAHGSWIVEGRVVGASDGDTITVLDRANVQHKIRLSGTDAREKSQALGDRSKEQISRLAYDRSVEAQCYKKDRYAREVETNRAGSRGVGGAEEEAKASRAGLWKDRKAVAPWEWRKAAN